MDLWGGRFSEGMDDMLRRFSSSLPVDSRLARQDLVASRAHAWALLDAGILDQDSFDDVDAAIGTIMSEVDDGTFPGGVEWEELPEDIHSAVETRLVQLCGENGQRLHAGRSRNDQVVTDVLLWLKSASEDVEQAVRAVQKALLDKAGEYESLVIPSYTHLQRAQPVLLAHHLMAHFHALERDIGRLLDARDRADRCPLGASALAGSTIPLDREATAKRLGFARVAVNSMDAVADRDWAIEFVGVCALTMTHLSRLAAELVLWSTQEFSIARMGDAWTTGSSAMPQKRNPDVAELVRGKAARVHGDLMTLHSLLKGLPLAYNRDLQEDKEPLFDAADTTTDCARLTAAVLAQTSFTAPRQAGPDFSSAMDLAEELVRSGVPFRRAHSLVGKLVVSCEVSGRGLQDVTDSELAELGLPDLDRHLLTERGSIEAKRTLGSTSPQEVARQLADARSVVG